MSESFARETINQLMEHCGPEETFADTERKLRQKIERLEAALRNIAAVAKADTGHNAAAVVRLAQRVEAMAQAALKGADHG